MIDLQSHANGVVLPLRAAPGARSDGVRGELHGALKVAVTQVAEKGKANKALLAVVCKQLGLRRSQVAILSGETSVDKRLLVTDISLDDLRQRIERTLADI